MPTRQQGFWDSDPAQGKVKVVQLQQISKFKSRTTFHHVLENLMSFLQKVNYYELCVDRLEEQSNTHPGTIQVPQCNPGPDNRRTPGPSLIIDHQDMSSSL